MSSLLVACEEGVNVTTDRRENHGNEMVLTLKCQAEPQNTLLWHTFFMGHTANYHQIRKVARIPMVLVFFKIKKLQSLFSIAWVKSKTRRF